MARGWGRCAALVAASTVTLGGCSVWSESGASQGGSSPAASQATPADKSTKRSAEPDEPLGTTYFSNEPIRIEVLSLGRVPGDMVRMRIRFTNLGDERATHTGAFAHPGSDGDNFGGITLVDVGNLQQYYPRQSTDDTYLASGYPSWSSYDPHDPITSTIYYPAPPASVREVHVVPGSRTVPVTDVPIADDAPPGNSSVDPSTFQLKPPDIEPLSSIRDKLGGGTSEHDHGDKVDLNLSSDVLFALNKAKLSPKAKKVLKRTAARVDKASATTVHVDGYTDNTGDDAINDPLSKRRAHAVKKSLSKLISRQRVSLVARGHGSSDPIASNKTKSGRQKNRRVTVSFEK